jgi:hypothetical protein
MREKSVSLLMCASLLGATPAALAILHTNIFQKGLYGYTNAQDTYITAFRGFRFSDLRLERCHPGL